MESNPARTRWDVLKRKIRDGSFFVLTHEIEISPTRNVSRAYRSTRHADQDIDFTKLIFQTKDSISRVPYLAQDISHRSQMGDRESLADSHTARANQTSRAPSSWEAHNQNKAIQGLSKFMDVNMKAIRRLSRAPPNDLSFAHIMSTYGTYGTTESTPPAPPLSMNISPSIRPTARHQKISSTSNPERPLVADALVRKPRSTSRTDSIDRVISSASMSRRQTAPEPSPTPSRSSTRPTTSTIASIISSTSFVKRPSASPWTSFSHDLISLRDRSSSRASDVGSVRSRRTLTNESEKYQNQAFPTPLLKINTSSMSGDSQKVFGLPAVDARGIETPNSVRLPRF